jgi:hypothetical protein
MSRMLLAVLLTSAVAGVVNAQLVPVTPSEKTSQPTHNLWVSVETIPGDFRWQYKGTFSSEQLARDAAPSHCPRCPETTTPGKPTRLTFIVLAINKCPDNTGDLGSRCPSNIPVTFPGGDNKTDPTVSLPCPPTPCVEVCQPVKCERPRLFPLFRRCR